VISLLHTGLPERFRDASRQSTIKIHVILLYLNCKQAATATLGGIALGNDGGIAAVIAACNAAVIAAVIASALPFSCQQ